MAAHESLDKRGKIVATIGQLRPHGEVVEGGVVDSSAHPGLIAVPVPADIAGQSEPAVKVVGDAGTEAARIGFQTAGHGKQSSGKQAVHVGAGIEEGVSAVELPCRSRLILILILVLIL